MVTLRSAPMWRRPHLERRGCLAIKDGQAFLLLKHVPKKSALNAVGQSVRHAQAAIRNRYRNAPMGTRTGSRRRRMPTNAAHNSSAARRRSVVQVRVGLPHELRPRATLAPDRTQVHQGCTGMQCSPGFARHHERVSLADHVISAARRRLACPAAQCSRPCVRIYLGTATLLMRPVGNPARKGGRALAFWANQTTGKLLFSAGGISM